MAKGEERRLTDVSISWTDASGQRLRLGPSKDVKITLLLRQLPKTIGWIQITFPNTDPSHVQQKSKGAKPRLLPTPDRDTFIDLLPPNIDVFSTTFQPRDEPDSVLVVDVTLEDPDVVWIRARDAGSVALSDAQMGAVHLLKSFSETTRFRISVPTDKKVKKHSWNWDTHFADDTDRTVSKYGFVVDKRRRRGLRKPRREADWRNYNIRGRSLQQPVQSKLPFNIKKSGKDVAMTDISDGLVALQKDMIVDANKPSDEAFRPGGPDIKKKEGKGGINREERDFKT